MVTPEALPHPVAHPSANLRRDLPAAVEGALWAYAPLRLTDAALRVTARDGVVTLSGNVRSRTIKAMAERLAMEVPGVTAVVNALAADPEIEREVAMALALDPGTRLATDRLTLRCLRGTVVLAGTVLAADLATARAIAARAASLARAVPGVTVVLDRLQAAAGPVRAAADGVVAPTGAGEDDDRQAVLQERMAVWRERASARR